jgi:hypothetical protein
MPAQDAADIPSLSSAPSVRTTVSMVFSSDCPNDSGTENSVDRKSSICEKKRPIMALKAMLAAAI